MSISFCVQLDNGKIWGAGHSLFLFPPKEVSRSVILIPINQINGMTDEEIGHYVRALLSEARYAACLERSTLIKLNTPRFTEEECNKWISELREFQSRDDDIADAITILQNRLKTIHGQEKKRVLTKVRRSQFEKNREQITLALIERDGYECKQCKTQNDLTIDHILPISKGGSDQLENLRFLCRTCNSKKGDKTRVDPDYSGGEEETVK